MKGLKGLYDKYIVMRSSEEPRAGDEKAQYFVLRLDTDYHAAVAAYAYAKSCKRENPILSKELIDLIDNLGWETVLAE